MSVRAPSAWIVTAAMVCVALVGCGASPPSPPTVSTSTNVALPPSSAAPSPSSPAAVDATVVEIAIAGGVVTPTNGQVQGSVGKPIVLKVNSDVADQLHVHSSPENTFDVEPRPGQSFEFTVNVPGQVDVELHDLNRTVVTIQVRP